MSEIDSLFIHTSKTTFISIYVDDITLIGPSSAFHQTIKNAPKSEFECKDLGDARHILTLGLEINCTDNGIEISQRGHVEKLVLKYGMVGCHPVSIPNTSLRKAEPGTEIGINEYQSMIGSLMYAAIGTRPI